MTVTSANGPEQAAAHLGPQARVFVGLKIVPEIAIQLVQLTAALKDRRSGRSRQPIFT